MLSSPLFSSSLSHPHFCLHAASRTSFCLHALSPHPVTTLCQAAPFTSTQCKRETTTPTRPARSARQKASSSACNVRSRGDCHVSRSPSTSIERRLSMRTFSKLPPPRGADRALQRVGARIDQGSVLPTSVATDRCLPLRPLPLPASLSLSLPLSLSPSLSPSLSLLFLSSHMRRPLLTDRLLSLAGW